MQDEAAVQKDGGINLVKGAYASGHQAHAAGLRCLLENSAKESESAAGQQMLLTIDTFVYIIQYRLHNSTMAVFLKEN